MSDLTDNRNMGLERLSAQIKHLNNFPQRKKKYMKILEQCLNNDIIEESEEAVPDLAGTYYMPHSGGWNGHKHTPLRVVFDASSRQRGRLPLNDVLYARASLVSRNQDILAASREMPIVLIAGVQIAFTLTRIQGEYRDLCRLLWLRVRINHASN
ncbi:hypothetical protein RB195_022377 [Necator americanus]|uniref:Uncharacterized protein n=1 Tax=Necator americanus TaxID=51031 RepID=A0ABR1EHN5_NECAM